MTLESNGVLDAVLRRIQHLRALANGASTDGERDAALNAIAQIIEKHRLSEAELEIRTGSPAESPVRDERFIYDNRFGAWEQRLAIGIAQHHGCRILKEAHKTVPGTTTLRLFGRPSDIGICHGLIGWLRMDLKRRAYQKFKGKQLPGAERSWLDGAVDGILSQLMKAREAERSQTATMSTALVKLDSRSDEAFAFMKEIVKGLAPKSRKIKRSRVDIDAYESGLEHGENVHLGQHLGSGPGVRSLKG